MSLSKVFPGYAVHLDFHTMPGIYDVGRDFNAKEFSETLAGAGVRFITVFARCNIGFAYYKTKIGVVHPGLKFDLLGSMVAACHSEGIKVAAYFNAGLSHEEALHHREWCKVNSSGQVYELKRRGHWFRRMCLNTGYGEHLLSMIGEVIEQYPVDGIFLDGPGKTACYGVECLEGMKKSGIDVFDEQQVSAFAQKSAMKFLNKVEKLARRNERKLFLQYNGVPFRSQPTHCEIEVLPNGEWGYDYLPWMLRYARTLGKPYVTMTGRFHKSWRDFGGLRTEHSLLFDCYQSVSNGGSCSIGDHLHPRGRLEPAVYSLIGRVYGRLREIEPWTDNARPETEIVVVDPEMRHCPSFLNFHDVPDVVCRIAGASRMLAELKYQFDVSDGEMDFSAYRVVILPDNVTVDRGLKDKLRAHLSRGGYIISSAFAGLDTERKKFALPEYRLDFEGEEPYHYTFVSAGKEINKGLPEMLLTVYRPGVAVRPKRGLRVLGKLYKPYFNHGSWDMRHENLYIPAEEDSGRPALVRSGNIFHFSFPVFAGYFKDAPVAYRTLLGNCLVKAIPSPVLRVDGMPSFGRATVMRKGKKRMVHLLSYVPELRGEKIQVIEEPVSVRDVNLSLRTDGRKVKKIYHAPSMSILNWHVDKGRVDVVVPEVNGYSLVVFEFA